MEERLRAYMDSIFRDVKPTRQSVELKEEILQNLIDKYNDLIGEGKTQEAAYNIAIASIGDIGEILEGMEKIAPLGSQVAQKDDGQTEKRRRMSAALTSIAVVMYILSILPPILLQDSPLEKTVAPALMFIIIAAATGILVFNYAARPQYRRYDDTIVEDFKEWNHHSDSSRQALKAINSALWSLTVVVYMLVSFTTMAWHITWIIFLIAAAIEKIIKAAFELKGN